MNFSKVFDEYIFTECPPLKQNLGVAPVHIYNLVDEEVSHV